MIYITHFRNANPRQFDELWAIVRRFKKCLTYHTHVPELSPNWDLFKTYLRLQNNEEWNEHTFQTIYKPQFMEQMKNDPEAQQTLLHLKELDEQGKKICLFCFCNDKNLCHRSLIAELLIQMGCNVILD